MAAYDSIVVVEDWISEHYLTTDSTKASFKAKVADRVKDWKAEEADEQATVRSRYSASRAQLIPALSAFGDAEDAKDTGRSLEEAAAHAHELVRTVLDYRGPAQGQTFTRGSGELQLGAWRSGEGDVVVLEARPAGSLEDVVSSDSRLLGAVVQDGKSMPLSTPKVVSELYAADEPPAFVAVQAGRWFVLTERERWEEGRYLAVDLLLVAERNDTTRDGEVERALAVTARESVVQAADGTVWWNEVLEDSIKHTVGVSSELREGVRESIEILANEVLERRTAQGLSNDDIDGQDLARQSLRYLYRILFLLYAEASPEMGVLPVGDENYTEGYGLDRLREVVLTDLGTPKAHHGTHLYQSLDVLFRLVNNGHRPNSQQAEDDVSRAPGLTFSNLSADLFLPRATALIDEAKLGNLALQQVLQKLLLSKEGRGKDRGFISYAELGINQLGSVYEGLMSYTGFIAQEDLHEVAKDGNATKGSWVVPVTRSQDIATKDFVTREDPITGERKAVVHHQGSFVFRLAGRERQQSASYYTPEVMTKFVVSQAIEELRESGAITNAESVLHLSVCEPALGSGAFAVEAVRQLADEYLMLRQKELGQQIEPEDMPRERQRVKAYLALHNVYGVDLNATAVELAEISLWLDTMVKDLQAPWFGLHLRRGNSLIGARRATYNEKQVASKSWLKESPREDPLSGLAEAMANEDLDPAIAGRIHHFLLPSEGWGAAADAKELNDLAGPTQAALKEWRKSLRTRLTKKDIARLQGLTQRVERLWQLALLRLQIAEDQIRRGIPLWGRQPEELPTDAVTREEIESALNDPNGAYQRLRRVMDAWNALWFWPLTDVAVNVDGMNVKPPSIDAWLDVLEGILGVAPEKTRRSKNLAARQAEGQTFLGQDLSWAELNTAEDWDRLENQLQSINILKNDNLWLQICERVAKQQGFFHWELDFAPTFAQGGFDLQVGNPPWVRPRTDESALLAEGDPWWQLTHKPTQAQIRDKRLSTLSVAGVRELFVEGISGTIVVAKFIGSPAEYSLLEKQQPDLYRAFMQRTWRSASEGGVVTLIHPESHFTERKAAFLRADAYRRLRRHWQFINELKLFEIQHQRIYGVHVYGVKREDPRFIMAASLYHPSVVSRSLMHSGGGEVPGLKDDSGAWDLRPHAERILTVDSETLRSWAALLEEPGAPWVEARMVYPLNKSSSTVLEKLSTATRARDMDIQYSSGWSETNDRRKGYFDVKSAVPGSWREAIVQGPHYTVANPFYKQPNPSMRDQQDYSEIDLDALPLDFVPRTNYQVNPSMDWSASYSRVDIAGKSISARELWRVCWRYMATPPGRRTLFVSMLPTGAMHTDGTMSAYTSDVEHLMALLATWSSIPVDFLVKLSGIANLTTGFVQMLPVAIDSLLVDLMIDRALRLVCLTEAYADLWSAVTGGDWSFESPVRRAEERRQAMVEIDVLVALAFGITIDELCIIYRTQFPVLNGFEKKDLYDANGLKVPESVAKVYRVRDEFLSEEERSWVHPQSGVGYVFELPFRTLDREADMRSAYAHFERILNKRQGQKELAEVTHG